MSEGRPTLSLERAALVMVGLSTVAFVGMPDPARTPAYPDGVHGFVSDEAGAGIAGADVFLFDDDALRLVEATVSDANGAFAFGSAPERCDVFAAASGHAGAWALRRESSPARAVRLELVSAPTVRVRVTDVSAAPIPGAEVRVFDASDAEAVIERRVTDVEGVAYVALPPRAHLAVFDPEHEREAWRVDSAELAREVLNASAASLEVVLGDPLPLRGTLLDDDGAPIAGTYVFGWSEDGAAFLGWTRSAPDGSFALDTRGAAARLRVVDPAGSHVATALLVDALAARDSRDAPIAFSIPRGVPCSLAATVAGAPIAARIRSISDANGAWSWPVRSRAGEERGVALRLTGRHTALVTPLDGSRASLRVDDLTAGTESLKVEVLEAESMK